MRQRRISPRLVPRLIIPSWRSHQRTTTSPRLYLYKSFVETCHEEGLGFKQTFIRELHP